jgi:hypothetical protein
VIINQRQTEPCSVQLLNKTSATAEAKDTATTTAAAAAALAATSTVQQSISKAS